VTQDTELLGSERDENTIQLQATIFTANEMIKNEDLTEFLSKNDEKKTQNEMQTQTVPRSQLGRRDISPLMI